MAEQCIQQEIIQCSRCKKKHFVSHFRVNRLGRRNKTCLDCNAQKKAADERNKCQHLRRRNQCKECGGASICQHLRRRNQCKECGGYSSICDHGRQRDKCFVCDPKSALWGRCSGRIVNAIGTEARAGRSTAELLGCSKEEFYYHIEAQFTGGMRWDRIAEIDIDHRIPIAYPGVAGGPPTLAEIISRLDHRNCQPLWREDNIRKGNRWADPLPK